MQVCTLLQTDNHASTSPLSFLQAGCPSCCPTNSIKALKAIDTQVKQKLIKTLQLMAFYSIKALLCYRPEKYNKIPKSVMQKSSVIQFLYGTA